MRSVDEMAARLASVRTSLGEHTQQAQVEIETQAYLRGASDALLWALRLDEESVEAEEVAARVSRDRLPDGIPDEMVGEVEARLRLAEQSRDRSDTLIRSVRALPFAREGYLLIACPDAPGLYPQTAWARLVPLGQAKQLQRVLAEALRVALVAAH